MRIAQTAASERRATAQALTAPATAGLVSAHSEGGGRDAEQLHWRGFNSIQTIASTVPETRDLNPYGVRLAPVSKGGSSRVTFS